MYNAQMFPVMMLAGDFSPSFSIIYLLWSQAVVPPIFQAREAEYDMSSLVVDGASQIAVMAVCVYFLPQMLLCFSFKGRWFQWILQRADANCGGNGTICG